MFFSRDDKVSFAFRLVFQSDDKTLTDDEVTVVMDHVTQALQKRIMGGQIAKQHIIQGVPHLCQYRDVINSKWQSRACGITALCYGYTVLAKNKHTNTRCTH